MQINVKYWHRFGCMLNSKGMNIVFRAVVLKVKVPWQPGVLLQVERNKHESCKMWGRSLSCLITALRFECRIIRRLTIKQQNKLCEVGNSNTRANNFECFLILILRNIEVSIGAFYMPRARITWVPWGSGSRLTNSGTAQHPLKFLYLQVSF